MADFTRLAAVAKRLIDKNGRTVLVVKQGDTPQDSDQPWRGQGTYPINSVSGKAVFVSEASLGYTARDKDNVKRADMVALFAAANDTGESLETYDVILDGGVTWQILKTELLQPADTRVLYIFEVSR